MRQMPLAMRLRERAVFDCYVSGPNASGLAQLRALIARGSGCAWVCGAAGVGKSHLLQAACAEATASGQMSAYLPLRELAALGAGVLDGWDDTRLLAMDDIARVAGEGSWEQALFRLYREAEERGALLLVADRAVPQAVPFLLPDLASRFAAATVLPVRALDESGQREALRLRAQQRGLELPEETAVYLQRRFRRDLPTLCGILDKIDEASLQAQRRLTIPFIRQVLLTPPAGA